MWSHGIVCLLKLQYHSHRGRESLKHNTLPLKFLSALQYILSNVRKIWRFSFFLQLFFSASLPPLVSLSIKKKPVSIYNEWIYPIIWFPNESENRSPGKFSYDLLSILQLPHKLKIQTQQNKTECQVEWNKMQLRDYKTIKNIWWTQIFFSIKVLHFIQRKLYQEEK